MTIRGFAESLLVDMGMELVEIQFRREGHGWVLRLFIDKEGGITIEDCATVSREISAYLEVEDLISHAYHLEVSSPGINRPLRYRRDFERFRGAQIRLKTLEQIDGRANFKGTLEGLDGDDIVMVIDGSHYRVPFKALMKARVEPEDVFSKAKVN